MCNTTTSLYYKNLGETVPDELFKGTRGTQIPQLVTVLDTVCSGQRREKTMGSIREHCKHPVSRLPDAVAQPRSAGLHQVCSSRLRATPPPPPPGRTRPRSLRPAAVRDTLDQPPCQRCKPSAEQDQRIAQL
ncbi:mCG1044723 [Mus musculus]|nr:mCG1044723 [Mus musculus]